MISILNMNLFKMFKSKSTWILCALSAGIPFFIIMIRYAAHSADVKAGLDMDISKQILMYIPMFSLIYIIIYSVHFVADKYKTRYINNIFGVTTRKYKYVITELICVFVFILTLLLVAVLSIIVSNLIFSGNHLLWSSRGNCMKVLGTFFFMYLAVASLMMFLANLFRGNSPITIGLVYYLALYNILYLLIDFVLKKIGLDNFSIHEYAIFGCLENLSNASTDRGLLKALIVASIYIVVFNIGSVLLLTKRDIQ